MTELRRQHRAAAELYRLPDARARLDERERRAAAILAPILADVDRATVPGYALWRGPDGTLNVQPVDPIDAAQLALWREATA